MRRRYDFGLLSDRVSCFTPEQDAVIRTIEETTQAEVIITAPDRWWSPYPSPDNQYNAFLSRPEIYRKKPRTDGSFRRIPIPCPEVNGELSYIRERPMKREITEEELQQYPEFLRMVIEIRSGLSETGSPCDIVTSECSGENIDRLLQLLLSFTGLLKMGWHLEPKRNYDCPLEWELPPLPVRKKKKTAKKASRKKPKNGTSD